MVEELLLVSTRWADKWNIKLLVLFIGIASVLTNDGIIEKGIFLQNILVAIEHIHVLWRHAPITLWKDRAEQSSRWTYGFASGQ